MLGGEISFKYCETCGDNNLPCRKITDCWQETFDIERYLKDALTKEELDAVISSKNYSKISTVIAASEKNF
jgi:hypothetical protein